ncbi:uncharacterized protein LOC108113915 [Drosophila eugracilis]|uniref:uncharacterized protein LOC108113915 n=1 Tax=Drosophila eugracilis TaxID=29029 RepID=UPI0007E7E586|nr:uncharacterized protein LOC108113915 [Drosophila eugracilis]
MNYDVVKNTHYFKNYYFSLANMSKTSRINKLYPVGSSSLCSISASGSGQSLEDMLHVTQVQTSEPDDADLYFYNDGSKKSNSDLEIKTSTPDLQKEVPMEPPYVALVSNLPMECTERELQKVFTNFSVCSLTIPKKGKRPKGFAYVEVDSRDELIRLLQLDKPKCRGRCLMIKISQNHATPQKLGAGDSNLGKYSSSECVANSEHYSASVSDFEAIDLPLSDQESPVFPGSESSYYGRESPITRQPSSMEELERRMEVRLQKLAEFENAESERAQNGCMDEQDSYSMSWSDILSETRSSEGN